MRYIEALEELHTKYRRTYMPMPDEYRSIEGTISGISTAGEVTSITLFTSEARKLPANTDWINKYEIYILFKDGSVLYAHDAHEVAKRMASLQKSLDDIERMEIL